MRIRPAFPIKTATTLVAAALAFAVAGCSSGRNYDRYDMTTTQSLPPPPPRPQTGMVQSPARPYGDGYNLGSSYEPSRSGEYRWNGNPTRVREGSAPPNLAPLPPPAVGADGQRTIVVRSGDTLYSLSRHYGVSVAALAEQNRLMSPSIHAGQTLVLPSTAR